MENKISKLDLVCVVLLIQEKSFLYYAIFSYSYTTFYLIIVHSFYERDKVNMVSGY